MVPSRQERTVVGNLGLFILAFVLSWYFVYLRFRYNQEFPLARLDSFLAGTAYRPFQFRMLVPWIVGALSSLGLGEPKTLYRWADVGALVGLYYAFRLYLRESFAHATAAFLAFTIFWALPWNYILAWDIPILLPYDLAAVAFFTAGLVLLRRRRWKWYYPLFAVATVNRETMLFLTVIFVATEYRRLATRTILSHAAVQAALWLGIRTFMAGLYPGNPGASFEFYHADTNVPHVLTNLAIFADPMRLALLASSFGFVWVLLLVGRKRLEDPYVRKSLWVIPPFLLMVFVIGNVTELRVYGELTAVVLTPALLIGASYLRQPE